MSELIDLVVGDGGPAGVPRKPHPGCLGMAIKPWFEEREKKLGGSDGTGGRGELKAENVLMVGDTPADIQCAKNIGARCVWCRFGYGSEEECLALKLDFVVGGLDEFSGLCVRR
jgi:phosphoglycolate phosphatase